jgi:hypothetical protein
MTTWKYDVIKTKDGVQMIEMYEDGSYAILDTKTELWAESKEELIETLEWMIKDLKDGDDSSEEHF